MDALALARWQFGLTATFHFFLVPLTLGLSILVALMETLYVRTGDELYLRMTKFWGKLFVINFAVGVVTGIVLEFQFGMNWAEYSRFMGDIFGAPLAIEALLAFFLESTFLGVWIFGWERVSKRVHVISIWLVALGSNLSALWILIANSFMQEPVGYVLRNGRAEMVDFWALLTNPHVWTQFPHVLAASMTTAAFFVLGISAYHLVRKSVNLDVFQQSFKWGAVYAMLATCLVIIIGHSQAQHMVRTQPMKMAAAEALWESQNPASMSLFTIGNEPQLKDVFAIRVPYLLSILAYNQPTGEVQGIKNLQAEYQTTYGPGNYIPPVAVSYWTFRFMVGAGFLMLVLGGWALAKTLRNTVTDPSRLLKFLPLAIVLPYFANTTGWMFTEIARQPWIVFGLQRTQDAVSKSVTSAEVLTSLILFTLVYVSLFSADAFLLFKFARQGAGGPTHKDTAYG
ncbi:MAG: cytochrome ubiquinol oxidase subunit I [Anaerolineales bacterium]